MVNIFKRPLTLSASVFMNPRVMKFKGIQPGIFSAEYMEVGGPWPPSERGLPPKMRKIFHVSIMLGPSLPYPAKIKVGVYGYKSCGAHLENHMPGASNCSSKMKIYF